MIRSSIASTSEIPHSPHPFNSRGCQQEVASLGDVGEVEERQGKAAPNRGESGAKRKNSPGQNPIASGVPGIEVRTSMYPPVKQNLFHD